MSNAVARKRQVNCNSMKASKAKDKQNFKINRKKSRLKEESSRVDRRGGGIRGRRVRHLRSPSFLFHSGHCQRITSPPRVRITFIHKVQASGSPLHEHDWHSRVTAIFPSSIPVAPLCFHNNVMPFAYVGLTVTGCALILLLNSVNSRATPLTNNGITWWGVKTGKKKYHWSNIYR